MRAKNIDDKILPHKSVLSCISSAKDELVNPAEYKEDAGSDMRKQTIAELYRAFEGRRRYGF